MIWNKKKIKYKCVPLHKVTGALIRKRLTFFVVQSLIEQPKQFSTLKNKIFTYNAKYLSSRTLNYLELLLNNLRFRRGFWYVKTQTPIHINKIAAMVIWIFLVVIRKHQNHAHASMGFK